jgi:hypothetical protein
MNDAKKFFWGILCSIILFMFLWGVLGAIGSGYDPTPSPPMSKEDSLANLEEQPRYADIDESDNGGTPSGSDGTYDASDYPQDQQDYMDSV